jgi:hypothetical protein
MTVARRSRVDTTGPGQIQTAVREAQAGPAATRSIAEK